MLKLRSKTGGKWSGVEEIRKWRETLAIVDASVVVKWFNMGEYCENAERLKEKHLRAEVTLVSLVLMVFEVLNALRYNP